MEVGEFVVVTDGMFGIREWHFFEDGDGGGEVFAVAHDADVAPHEVADFGEGFGGGGGFWGGGGRGRQTGD